MIGERVIFAVGNAANRAMTHGRALRLERCAFVVLPCSLVLGFSNICIRFFEAVHSLCGGCVIGP